MTFQARSPTRIDLAGGTLDCWPLYLLVDGAITTNVSVKIWTRAHLEARDDSAIEIHVRDLEYQKRFKNLAEMLQCSDGQLDLIRAQIGHWQPGTGFLLETASESPVGGGLGGSSSLCISLIDVFSRWQKKSLTIPEIVTLAGNLEAQVLKKPTGTQDYFGALSRGLNAIHYTPAGARLERLKVDETYLDQRLSLIYTGKPHHSGLNNWKVLKEALDGEAKTVTALRELKVVADDMYRLCQSGQWHGLAELFRREYKARVALSEGFSSPEIRRLEELVLKAGADAVKICGAGGGGCVLILSSPDRKPKVEAECQKAGFVVLNAPIAAEQ